MRSILVEFTRFDDLQTGILRKGDKYLRTIKDHSPQQVQMSISQMPFKDLTRKLRYSTSPEQERLEAVKEASELVSDLLRRHENQEKYEELCDLIKKGGFGSLEKISKMISDLHKQSIDGSILEEGPLIKELNHNQYCDSLQQIDLVANASELSTLPFEAALSEKGKPLFLRGVMVLS
ncbi:MAG: hypothetical protein KZQ78_09645 [Candidatus Thiodiazotropha sp. (ex Ustalcina ferruginea)]|nr:hypothetical protein [Candidatus Thiodiazotropha sp. (ex Ustalcina ferruginea)]